MKIYEIGTGYTPIPAQMGAATEIVVEELTRSFIKNGEDVEIIDIKASSRPETDLPITEVGVPACFTKTDVSLGIMHKLKRVVYSVSLARKLKRILKVADERVVLHFHNQYNLYFFLKLVPAKLRAKATIAYTVHSYIWGTEWEKIEGTVKKKYFQEVYCVKNANIVFVLNDITVDHFVSRLGVDPGRIRKALNGVNTSRYAPLPAEKVTALKVAHGLEGKKVIFQVGSVCDRKNQLGSVEMLADLLGRNEDVVYMYAGGIIDPDYKQRIDSLAADSALEGRVIYAGELAPGEVLNEYYNMADCCVFTSTLESFGLVIIEAVSAGTRVVVGENLMFDLNGGYGMYHSPEEFVQLVEEALRGDGADFDRKAAVGKYDWDSVALEHAAEFKR